MKAYGIEVGKDADNEMAESEDAAQDILDAISAKDAKALDLALQRHYECCEANKSADDEDDAPDSED